MAKNLQADVANMLQPFRSEIGSDGKFTAVCNNVASFLGRQQVTTIDGDWECSAKCKLVSKDKNEMQLPLNDARSILIRFALNLNKLAKAGEFEVNATLPKQCIAWIDKVEAAKAPEQKPVEQSA